MASKFALRIFLALNVFGFDVLDKIGIVVLGGQSHERAVVPHAPLRLVLHLLLVLTYCRRRSRLKRVIMFAICPARTTVGLHGPTLLFGRPCCLGADQLALLRRPQRSATATRRLIIFCRRRARRAVVRGARAVYGARTRLVHCPLVARLGLRVAFQRVRIGRLY